MSEQKVFNITFGGSVRLSVDEIWPDGDGPEDPTPEDVVARMEEEINKHSLVDEWGLEDDLEITVAHNGKRSTW